jgi:uncharacterized protein
MRTRKIIGATALACAAVVTMAAPAFAHVTVNPSEATKGGFQTLTFQVPNEEASANTVSLAVQLPTDHPFAFVSVQPKAGWTYSAPKTPLATPLTTDEGGQVTEAVSEITWTGGQIKPGEFDTFVISVGTLPDDVDSLSFPAVQTYDDGTVVNWTDPVVEGQPEPEHPAPTLQLVAGGEGGHGGESSDSSNASVSSSEADAADSDSHNDDSDSKGLAIAALVVGGLGLITGGIALARGRASRASQT